MSDSNFENVVPWPIVPRPRPLPPKVTMSIVSPIDLIKVMTGSSGTITATNMAAQRDSYEIAMERKIGVTESRIDGLQETGDYEGANREISYRDGLTEALRAYKRWRNA